MCRDFTALCSRCDYSLMWYIFVYTIVHCCKYLFSDNLLYSTNIILLCTPLPLALVNSFKGNCFNMQLRDNIYVELLKILYYFSFLWALVCFFLTHTRLVSRRWFFINGSCSFNGCNSGLDFHYKRIHVRYFLISNRSTAFFGRE